MKKIIKKHLTIPARLYGELDSENHRLALLQLIAQGDRVAIFANDGYEATNKRHKELPCLIANGGAFKKVVIDWLAWQLGVDVSSIQKLPNILDELERYRTAYEALDEVFSDVPGYMGDESYGDKLSLTLSATRDLAKWKHISLAEFQGKLDPETDGGE